MATSYHTPPETATLLTRPIICPSCCGCGPDDPQISLDGVAAAATSVLVAFSCGCGTSFQWHISADWCTVRVEAP